MSSLMKLSKLTPKNIYWYVKRKLGNYYGQFNPPMDYLIEKHLPHGLTGTCVEVGAADGVSCSNTLHFERKGWNCLCIEPNPLLEKSLREHRKNVMMCAVSDVPAERAVFHVAELNPGNFEAISSLEVDKRLLASHEGIVTKMFDVEVPVKTLDECVAAFNPSRIDFITIDTEGTEIKVLKGFDIRRWQVPLLIVENNFSDPDIENYLKDFGYHKILRYESNDFFRLERSV
ncbi:FkbM family methyltransferase [candidate division KSB1 bacterium]|nr:MAG: FkbM family methyltransferase [candidate division KSB1 bacterium]